MTPDESAGDARADLIVSTGAVDRYALQLRLRLEHEIVVAGAAVDGDLIHLPRCELGLMRGLRRPQHKSLGYVQPVVAVAAPIRVVDAEPVRTCLTNEVDVELDVR